MPSLRPSLMIAAAITMLVAAAAAPKAIAQETEPDRPVVTVIDFETGRTGWVPPPHLGATLADLLADKLVSSGEYRVFDRQWLADPTNGGRLPPLALLRDQAVQAGVGYVVVGSVMRLSNETRQRTLGGIGIIPFGAGGRKQETDAVIGLTIRVIDARTGELVASTTAQGRATRKKRTIGLISLLMGRPGIGGMSTSAVGSHEAMLDEALHQAVEEAGASLKRAAPQIRRQAIALADRRSLVSYTSSSHAACDPDDCSRRPRD